MRIINGLYTQSIEPRPRVVAVGAFDGVHRGHQSLLQYVCRTAADRGVESAVFTFEPLPAEVFQRHDDTGLRLTVRDERNALLQEQCVDLAIVADFDHALRSMSAYDFARDVLVGLLNTKLLVASQRHTLGRNAEADVGRIAELGRQLGFGVDVLPPLESVGTNAVTSTRIRKLLRAGDVAEAALLLGRPYSLAGPVVSGRAVGRTLGSPTANIEPPPEKLLPADGVYAAFAASASAGIEGLEATPAAVFIGPVPTFGVEGRVVEVHLLDGVFRLEGTRLRVHLVERIRGVEKFDTPEALRSQIAVDLEHIREACRRFREAAGPDQAPGGPSAPSCAVE